MPQFDVQTPERLCNACVKTQSVIFDLHAKLTTTRNGLDAHQARHARLMQCAQTLQVGAMFNCFLEGSMRPRKLALSDDLLMIALINTRTNKVTNAYEVLAISVSAGAHDDAKEAIGNSQLCFTMACSDQIFTLQALNGDSYQYWMDGIHLAQEMVMHKERVAEFEAAVAETSAKLHEAIQSQIHYAFPKVFPESAEPQSALTLIEESEANGDSHDHSNLNTSDDESLSKSGNQGDANGDGGATAAVEIAPPAALKMGRSLPRQPGYMSPSYDPTLSPIRSPRSPTRTLSPVTSHPSSPTPATSTLNDDSSPIASPSESSLSKRASTSARNTMSARATEESRPTTETDGIQSPIFESDEHLRGAVSPANQLSHLDVNGPVQPPNSLASESGEHISQYVSSKPIASSRKLDFGIHALAGTPSSVSSYSPPISNLATTTPKRIEAMPQSLDARAIVSGIANTNLSSSHLSSTFDSLPSTPQNSEKIDDSIIDISTPNSSPFIGTPGTLDTPEKLAEPSSHTHETSSATENQNAGKNTDESASTPQTASETKETQNETQTSESSPAAPTQDEAPSTDSSNANEVKETESSQQLAEKPVEEQGEAKNEA